MFEDTEVAVKADKAADEVDVVDGEAASTTSLRASATALGEQGGEKAG